VTYTYKDSDRHRERESDRNTQVYRDTDKYTQQDHCQLYTQDTQQTDLQQVVDIHKDSDRHIQRQR